MNIRQIPSRYGRGVTVPSAAGVAKFEWGYRPLLWAVKLEPKEEAGLEFRIQNPEAAVPKKKADRVYVSRSAEPWEVRRAVYLARKAG